MKVFLNICIFFVFLSFLGTISFSENFNSDDSILQNKYVEINSDNLDVNDVCTLVKISKSCFSWLSKNSNWIATIGTEALAAFLGVFFASIATKAKDQKQFIRMENELIEELKEIQEVLKQYDDNSTYVFVFDTPCWDIYSEAGGLPAFYVRNKKKSKKIKDKTDRSRTIIDAYNSIAAAKRIEDIFMNLLTDPEEKEGSLRTKYYEKTKAMRNEARKDVLERIKKALLANGEH